MFFEINKKSILSFIEYTKEYDFNIQVILGGYCADEKYWIGLEKIIPENFIIHRFDENFGKAYVVNNLYSMYADKSIKYLLTCDSDIIFDLNQKNLFSRLISTADLFEKNHKKPLMMSLNLNEFSCHEHNNLTSEIKLNGEILKFKSSGGGIAGCCNFLNTDLWKAVGGYKIMCVYGGDDGQLCNDI